MRRGARGLGGLVLRLLRFHELRANGGMLSVRRLSISRGIEDVTRSFRRLTRGGRVGCRLRVSPNVR